MPPFLPTVFHLATVDRSHLTLELSTADPNRTEADGANLLARAVAPHGGVVMWRAFVYGNGKTGQEDRARQSADTFLPLDGRFDSNVIVQVKNGPCVLHHTLHYTLHRMQAVVQHHAHRISIRHYILHCNALPFLDLSLPFLDRTLPFLDRTLPFTAFP